MKPFNLKQAKAGKPVCRRDGKEAKILDFDFYTPNYHDYTKPDHFMVVKIKERADDEIIELYKLDGLKNHDGTESWDDLMMKTEKNEGWVNVYKKDGSKRYVDKQLFNTSVEAMNYGEKWNSYITTTKIEWEE